MRVIASIEIALIFILGPRFLEREREIKFRTFVRSIINVIYEEETRLKDKRDKNRDNFPTCKCHS